MIAYAVLRLSTWADVRLESPHPLLARTRFSPPTNPDPEQPFAFLPVFQTREAALDWADGNDALLLTVEMTPA